MKELLKKEIKKALANDYILGEPIFITQLIYEHVGELLSKNELEEIKQLLCDVNSEVRRLLKGLN